LGGRAAAKAMRHARRVGMKLHKRFTLEILEDWTAGVHAFRER